MFIELKNAILGQSGTSERIENEKKIRAIVESNRLTIVPGLELLTRRGMGIVIATSNTSPLEDVSSKKFVLLAFEDAKGTEMPTLHDFSEDEFRKILIGFCCNQ